ATDSGWSAAKDLMDHGANIAAIVDPRASAPTELARSSGAAGVRVFTNAVVIDAVGGRRLRGLKIRSSDGRIEDLPADVLAVSGGWDPSVGIGCNLGGRPVWSEQIHAYVLTNPPAGMTLAGSAAGHFSLSEALGDGARAA